MPPRPTLDDVAGEVLKPFALPVDTGLPQAPEVPRSLEESAARVLEPFAQQAGAQRQLSLGEVNRQKVRAVQEKLRGLSWGPGLNSLNSLMLGGLIPAMGAFGYNKENLHEARKVYEEVDPLGAAITTAGPGALTASALMGLGQEYAIAPYAAQLARAMPALAPLGRFLGGTAGKWSLNPLEAAPKVASTAASGATQGAVGGALMSPLFDEPLGEQAATGAKIGGVLGPPLAAAGRAFHGTYTPTTLDTAQRALDISPQAAPRVGQLPGAPPFVQALDRLFTGKGVNAAQREAVYEELTKRAGLPSKTIDQKWVQDAEKLNGGEMGRIAKGYEFDASDSKTIGDLAKLDVDAQGSLTTDGYEKFRKLLDKVEGELAAGNVPGSKYQAWTQHNGLLASYAKDPMLRPFVTGPNSLREILDNGWERSIASSSRQGAAEDAQAWQQARHQYKVTRTLDDLVDEASGQLNPQKLLGAVQKRWGNALRAGEVGDLARAGQFLPAPDKSPSKIRSVVAQHPAASVGGALAVGGGLAEMLGHETLGTALGAVVQHPIESALAASPLIAATAGGKVLNNALGSSAYTQYVLDRLAKRPLSGAGSLLSASTYPLRRSAIPLATGVTESMGQ